MACEYLIVISTIFGLLCYSTDIYSLYGLIKTVKNLDHLEKNMYTNLFALQIRTCVIVSNTFMLTYNIENNIHGPIISFSIFVSLDGVILITRIYFNSILSNKYAVKNYSDAVHKINSKSNLSDISIDVESLQKNPLHDDLLKNIVIKTPIQKSQTCISL